jgi:hypothetical protein
LIEDEYTNGELLKKANVRNSIKGIQNKLFLLNEERNFCEFNLKTNITKEIAFPKDVLLSESYDSLDLDTEILCAGTSNGNILFFDLKRKIQ